MRPAPVSLARIAHVLREHGLEVELRAPEDAAVTDVTQDSREVTPGALFLAWKGSRHDAHAFVEAAAQAGAGAALVERWMEGVGIPQLRVSHGRRGAGIAAMAALGDPQKEIRVTGVTGTNGKTTTALLLRHLLGAVEPTAALGTLGVVGPDGRVWEGTGGLTTPGPAELAHRFRALADQGVRQVVLEASSHAMAQHRLDALRFDAALFTNLTRDHLDYHGSMEAYRDAKARLLSLMAPDGHLILNDGEPAWDALPATPGSLRRVRVEGGRTGALRERPAASLRGTATSLEAPSPSPRGPAASRTLPALLAREVTLDGTGARFRLALEGEPSGSSVSVALPLLGRFNVENAALAAGGAMAAGMELGAIARGLDTAPAPPGRMEVTVTEPVPVILDYAHTPDALARALETLTPLYPGRVIVVFGAGGDRDRTKRPEMGRIAAALAGWAIATSDNPRTEDPERILDDVVAGMPAGGNWERIPLRRDAIDRALTMARPGDAILLAGKGHETYQVVGTEVLPFDEREVVRSLLAGRRKPRGDARGDGPMQGTPLRREADA